MDAMLTAFLTLANTVAQMIGSQKALSIVDQLKQVQTDLLFELAKGYDSDDAKVESLYGQQQICSEALTNELALYQKGVVSAPSASTP